MMKKRLIFKTVGYLTLLFVFVPVANFSAHEVNSKDAIRYRIDPSHLENYSSPSPKERNHDVDQQEKLQSPSLNASAEAYAVFNDGILTFYYDGMRSSREGDTYSMNSENSWPGWKNCIIKKVVFMPSFANARPSSTYSWFDGQSSLIQIIGLQYLNTSQVTWMTYMFDDCESLTSLDVSHFNTENSIDMDYLFFNCKSLTNLDVSGFNTRNVTSMGHMFDRCENLTSLDVSHFNTENVTYMGAMFYGCEKLTCLDVSGFDTGNVTDMNWMFYGCSNLTSLDISGFSLGKNGEATSVSGMFTNCGNLSTIYCNEDWNFLNVELPYYKYLFDGCYHLVGGSGTQYNANYTGLAYARLDGGSANPGYFTAKTNIFPDCPTGEMRDAAMYLYNLGIVEGENGMLLPNREAKRAEVAKISLYGAYNGRANVPSMLPSDNFPSVYYDLQDTSTYYYRPARALLYLEYGDGVTPFDRDRLAFEPDSMISRLNVLKVLLESFNIKPDLTHTNIPFPGDADVVALASKNPVKMGYIRRAVELGIITTNNTTFRPHDKCTRGEIILMLARLMKNNNWQIPHKTDYFEPLNTTLKTIALGLDLPMGNFNHYTKTSFAIDGTVPLNFAHTYNSYNTTLPEAFYGARTVNGIEETYQPMGDGWSHSYHSFVTVVGNPASGDARLIVHWGSGGIDVYKSNGSQLVAESLGVYDDCTYDGGNVYITNKRQITYCFKPLGGSVLYLTNITDRNGNKLTVNYESGMTGFKRVKSVSDGYRSLTFSYRSGTDLVSQVTDPLNRSIKFSYLLNNQTGRFLLSSFTDAKGQTTNYVYGDASTAGSSKLLTRIQLPKGNYIENEYDANRRLKKTESGTGNVPTTQTAVTVAATYGNNCSVSTQSTVDVKRGNLPPLSYHYAYNGNNVVTSMTGSEGLYVNSSYSDPSNPQLPTAMQSNSTNVSNVTYDEKGNVTRVTVTGNGTLTTMMTYDTMNNLTSLTDPNGYTTTYSYDANGNLTGITAPEGVTTGIARDSRGQPTTVTNPMGVKTNIEYNTYGNLVKTTLPALGLTTRATYDLASRMLTVTDALDRTTSFSYDKNDNLLSETNPTSHTTRYAYDSNDNLTSITNAKNGVTTLTYDNATDWLTAVAFAGSTKQYSYNEDGSLKTYTKPDGTKLNYTYDNLGRITSDGVNSYSYDNKLRLSSITGSGKTLSFSYDGFNRVSGTSCGGNSNSYTYDKNGNCLSINSTTYGYDKLNRMTSVSFNNKTITYAYRKDNRLSKVTYPNGMITTFTYDAVGRPTGKTTKLGNGTVIASYSVTLDKHGNILSQTTKEPYSDMVLGNEDISYTYNSGNRITKAGTTSFAFDANGNTTQRGSESYTWDKKDRLTKSGSTSITYDPLGLIASYGITTFTTDPLGMGNVLSDSKSGASYIYGNGLEARVINGATSYYVTDMRGSVVAIVNESGTITHKYQYDEFGKVVQKQEANYNPFQYVGKYGVMYLSDHLYYMRARHYDPTIGRFLSEDPIWSTNLYPYADNNPIMGIDPEGTSVKGFFVGAGAGAVAGTIVGAGLGAVAGAGVGAVPGAIAGAVIGFLGGGIWGIALSTEPKIEPIEQTINRGNNLAGWDKVSGLGFGN